ncbi:TadG family pilus assembly protein [Thauera propionica]|uniref:TadG family pilus assembly protein n=1 Tax=Thauera propionica TaxID=2019431 RepID=UPI0023F1C7CE|nr:TadG family pilus assembly protein [Thauera propionica]MDD3676613.1 pilus assembly protein TadG-related protein [Thauera propionica]
MLMVHRCGGALGGHRQQGAIAILAAGVLLTVLLATALSVDLGRLFLEKRRLQMIADLAALEASLALTDCSPGARRLLSHVQNRAREAAKRNGYEGSDITVELGNVSYGSDGLRSFAASPASPQAVRVALGRTVPRSLLVPGELAGDVALHASAVAGTEAVGTLEAGSFLARLDTASSPLLNALLGRLLGTSIALDAASYRGLAQAHVTLLDLIEARADVGNVDELLDLDLGIRDFVLLGAEALSRDPKQKTVALMLFDIANAITLDVPLRLRLGDLLRIGLPDRQAALDAKINVLQLLSLGAQVANAKHLVQVELGSGLLDTLGVADIDLDLYIIEPPSIAIGPAGRDANGEWLTRVTSAQINLQLHLRLLDLLNLKPQNGLVNLDLFVQAPATRAGFEQFGCADGKRTATVGYVAQALRVGVGQFDDISKRNPRIEPSHVLSLPLHLIGIEASADLGLGTSTDRPGQMLFDAIPQTRTVDNNELGHAVSNLLGDLVDNLSVEFDRGTILGFVLDLLLSPILDLLGLGDAQGLLDYLQRYLLSPVLEGLDVLLAPLLDLLGLNLAGADISVLDVSVTRPRLLM